MARTRTTAGAMTQRIKLVIMQALVMDDKIMHIVKACSVSAVSIVRPTTKGSCQVVYQGKVKIIFHAKG
jgi:hypothetical protein